MFRATGKGPYPSEEHCAEIAKFLSEAMPVRWQHRPGLEAFARFNDVDREQVENIERMRRGIARCLATEPQPWFPADWKARLAELERAIRDCAPILAGPNFERPPDRHRHWHDLGWHIAELARRVLIAAGHQRKSVGRRSRAARFTVQALNRIGITGVDAIAVERMHAEMVRRTAEK